jgi:hypothetical protein
MIMQYTMYLRLILPCFGSDRIYVVDCMTDPRNPKLDKVWILSYQYSQKVFIQYY